MKVLVIGGGGREHALAWKLAQSPEVTQVYVAPGNAGTAAEAKVRNVAVAADDLPALLDFARGHGIDLTVVGPEAPLVAGVTDLFQAHGLKIFGPTQAAARLEASKAFTKDFLARHGIPTADYRVFDDAEAALAHLRERPLPLVVKADGLAAGKGVIVAHDRDTALSAVEDMLAKGRFGAAGRRVVVEDFLEGEEASFIALVDGRHVLPLAGAQDHKPRDDGDRGPNTGGMGAYSPAPVLDAATCRRVMDEIMIPTVTALAEAGTPFTGFLYAGLMIGPDGTPRVLEFNVRCGDPETQPLLMRLRSDLAGLLLAALDGRLDRTEADWDPRAALGVVMAAGGYPEAYRKGDPIEGLAEVETDDVKVFHAGTRLAEDGRVVTDGGRVLCITALGATVAEAQARAYRAVERIHWRDRHYRRDIGHRAVARERRS
ncbi:MAG: phosphoribosylamine--glycine ligase [Gammaproteobacteria bacterium]|nr:MAG: phosphoribosylamine--glycine ligase [Gammaproteobacteria bacterium]